MTNTKRIDIQAVKDVVVPGAEYYLVELKELTGLDTEKLWSAVLSLLNLDYLMTGMCDVTGLTTYRTL